MGRGYSVAAIVLGLTLLLGKAEAQDSIDPPADSPTVEESGAEDAEGDSKPTREPAFPIRIVEDPEKAARAAGREDDSDEREKGDLAAQNTMAKATEQIVVISWAQLCLAAFGTLIAAFGTVAVFWNLKLARQSNEMAARTAETAYKAYIADHRTWLKLSPHSIGPVTFDGNTFRVSMSALVRNIGGAPAQSIQFEAKAFHGYRYVVGKSGLDTVLYFHEFLTKNFDTSGTVLLPDEIYEFNFSGSSESDPVTDAKARKAEESLAKITESGATPPAGAPNLSIAFCVSYLVPGSDVRHRSGHVVWVSRRDRQDWVEGETVNPENLQMALMTVDAVID